MSDSAKPIPTKEAILATLKGFQKATVAHVMQHLNDPSGSRRFLVADEVGLGKTLIARGVVAEFVERAWQAGEERVDIVYVCSNTALATENLKKLHIGGACIEATRLTLLPMRSAEFHDRLNFFSFTPSTALSLNGYGRSDERVVLYHLLSHRYGDGAWLKNLLRGHVAHERWLEQLRSPADMDEELKRRFLRALRSKRESALKKDLKWARETLTRHDRKLDDDAGARVYHTVERLRRLLAHSCIAALEPDLIILDEFQRFKDLLSSSAEDDPATGAGAANADDTPVASMADLASTLFEYETPSGSPVATLLLSATPYRSFSTHYEPNSAENYTDFVDTLRFLSRNDGDKIAEVERALSYYRLALLNAAQGDSAAVVRAREVVEAYLKSLMVRTERVDSTKDRDAMVAEPPIPVAIAPQDLRHYMAAEELAEALDSRDIVELWKSAPYLFNFMKTYRVKNDFDDRLHIKKVRDSFSSNADQFLTRDQIQAYAELDPANGRLRALTTECLGNAQWSMLWLPPTVPYWTLGEPWKSNADFSKKLVFSAWNVVPDAVSALLSYEAERHMVGDEGDDYTSLHGKHRGLLRFSLKDGKPSNMTLLTLTIPSLTLADEISPLQLALRNDDVHEAAANRIRELLEPLKKLQSNDTPDPRWYWAAPLLLDANAFSSSSANAEALEQRRAALIAQLSPGSSFDDGLDVDDEDGLRSNDEVGEQDALSNAEEPAEGSPRDGKAKRAHLALALRVVLAEERLGAMPEKLVDTLTEISLGSPAVLLARSLRTKGVSDTKRREAAALVAEGFRSLFNQPAVMLMLKRQTNDADEHYWRTALHYAIDGNLQAVLDEQLHLLWEQAAWGNSPADEVCAKVATQLADGITTKVSRIVPDIYKLEDGSLKADKRDLSLRTSFALRYGAVRGSSGATEAREESVRAAFKSPFFPFVLISTSVGQEGLDFHPWCHDIWHWNLPGNPVDLEQREGRVHRYKGLAVRRNVAQNAFAVLKERCDESTDPWDVLFQHAEQKLRPTHASELVPYWIAPGPHKVRRCVPMLPYSSEIEQLQKLKQHLAIYRLVFGQPRQEELVTILQDADVSREELETWTVSLKPDAAIAPPQEGTVQFPSLG